MVEHCMFGCKSDNYENIGDHWDLVCKGNPEVKQMINCALCGKEIEKHCSLICQECWDEKHEKAKRLFNSDEPMTKFIVKSNVALLTKNDKGEGKK